MSNPASSNPADLQREIDELEQNYSILLGAATDPTRSAEAQSNASALAVIVKIDLGAKKKQRMSPSICTSQFLLALSQSKISAQSWNS